VKLDQGLTEEIGFSLGEFVDGCWEFIRIGRENKGITNRLARSELASKIHESLTWPLEKCLDFIDMLALKERDDFLSPEAPFTGSDVYPWVFDRRLSHVRRPLIFVTEPHAPEPTVVWSTRHTFLALRSFVA